MLLRKQLRSVRKVTATYLHVSRQTANSFTRRMNDIKVRGLATKPPDFQALHKPNPAPGDVNGDGHSNGWAHSQLEKELKPSFMELVFATREPRPAAESREEAQRIAEETAVYNSAVEKLLQLQTNREAILQSASSRTDTLTNTVKYLERSGLLLSDVEKLSIIHVAGTKGKGSTCALTESILRHYGARTGFFSSPHLVSTNERIRINGDPLPKGKFAHYFSLVYDRLKMHQEHERDMPAFFTFLTILGFHVFIAERVDVVVLEVGIGGELDCTNILRNVRTAGITSLAIEHVQLLGNTLEQIAWQKAGIIKDGAHVYTHVTQPECLEVIQKRADERNAQLIRVSTTDELFASNNFDYLDRFNDYVRLNGSLATQLAYDWLRQTKGPLHRDYEVNRMKISDEVLCGLSTANWPGRCQMVTYGNMRVHLDGAHTVESMRVCSEWFQKSTKTKKNPRILVFNRTGETDTTAILSVLLHSLPFDMVCFVPNLISCKPNEPSQTVFNYSNEAQRERSRAIAATWEQLCAANNMPNNGKMYFTVLMAFEDMRYRYPDVELDVLITGSIHLLGAAIVVINEFPLEEAAALVCDTPTSTNGHT